MSQDALLDEFFGAIVAGDLDTVGRLYTDDVEVWHNVTERSLDHARSLRLLRHYVDTVAERRYEILARHHWDGGAVQRHVLHGRVGETVIRAQVCLTFAFRDGRIAAIHEYLDAQAVAAMTPQAPAGTSTRRTS